MILLSLYVDCDNEIQLPCKWQGQLYNLERLKVLRVHSSGCSSLLVISACRSLQQLEELEISHCAVLEEIVKDVRLQEPSIIYNKTGTLKKLKLVILAYLPNLKSFIYSTTFECHIWL